MRRYILPALLLLLTSGPVQAGGYGLTRCPSGPRVYYTPAVIYYPVAVPVPCSVPVVPMQTIQPAVAPSAPYAVPRAAPPSVTAEPPMSSAPSDGTTTKRVGESFYQVSPGPVGMSKAGGRCSVAFWNLTGRALSLRVDSRDVSLPVGKSATLDVPSTFAWQVTGREGEATSIPTDRGTAEVLIRR